jgi:hypothetical protein
MMFRVVFWDILPCKMIVDPDDGGSTAPVLLIAQGYGLIEGVR